MRSRYARVDAGNLDALLTRLDTLVRQEAVAELEKIAHDSADVMRNKIRSSGTEFSADAKAAGLNKGPGRVRTGQMLEDVTVRTESYTSKTFINFGWVHRFQKYYSYQETGFNNYWARGTLLSGGTPDYMGRPIWTEGMFALFDARAYANKRMVKFRKNMITRIQQIGRK